MSRPQNYGGINQKRQTSKKLYSSILTTPGLFGSRSVYKNIKNIESKTVYIIVKKKNY